MTDSTRSLETATLGGGGFWCLDAVYRGIKGVTKVESVYAGGTSPGPSYEQVCSGRTGHAEVVQVTFDPSVISYRELLDIFFVIHHPTTLNRQGGDVGTQYRSVIFYQDDAQRRVAEESIRELEASDRHGARIVTELAPAPEFFVAEPYYQDYFTKNPGRGYRRAVLAPKVAKARKAFFEKCALVILAVMLLHGCIQIEGGSKKQAKIDTTSSGGAVITPAKPGATTPMPDTYGADSATPIRGAGPTEIGLALQSDTMHALEPDSTPASAPSGVDLAVLQSEMMVPVTGVTRAALHDTYNELRGGGTRPHEALDILAPRGTPVLSSTNGRVLKLFNSKAGGLMVYAADSTNHFILMYGHLDAYASGLAEGQPLVRGQKLGIVGTTGNAPANTPHLHFAIARSANVNEWWKGTPVNPFPLLTGNRSP